MSKVKRKAVGRLFSDFCELLRTFLMHSRFHLLHISGFVIGTDGIKSAVRECLLETEGVRMESLDKSDDMVNVGFISKELGSILIHQNPGLLHFVMNGTVRY